MKLNNNDKFNKFDNMKDSIVIIKGNKINFNNSKLIYVNNAFLKLKRISLKKLKKLKSPIRQLFMFQNSESSNYELISNILKCLFNNNKTTSIIQKLNSHDNNYIYNCNFILKMVSCNN
ncbi:MAG: hypothetical protein ACK5HL_00455 [Bacilli bacterium]